MNKTLQLLIGLLLIAVLLYAGYEFGERRGRSKLQTQLTENYSFVREIAELASLEVAGTSQIRSTNLVNDNSWSDAFTRMFTEQTVYISVPYTAKYGVNLNDSSIRIRRNDSLVEVHLPAPSLLSLELHLDRMETVSREGFFTSTRPEVYAQYQKQLYSAARKQLESNPKQILAARSSLEKILVKYFESFGLHARCIFDLPTGVTIIKD
jgi:hypothetical protein